MRYGNLESSVSAGCPALEDGTKNAGSLTKQKPTETALTSRKRKAFTRVQHLPSLGEEVSSATGVLSPEFRHIE